jgi:hypothetical protein
MAVVSPMAAPMAVVSPMAVVFPMAAGATKLDDHLRPQWRKWLLLTSGPAQFVYVYAKHGYLKYHYHAAKLIAM